MTCVEVTGCVYIPDNMDENEFHDLLVNTLIDRGCQVLLITKPLYDDRKETD